MRFKLFAGAYLSNGLISESVVTLMLLSIVARAATISINIANQRLQYPVMLRKISTALIINANSAFSVAISRILPQV